MATVTKDWEASDIHGNLLAKYRPFQLSNVVVGAAVDGEKIANKIRKIQKVGLLRFDTLLHRVDIRIVGSHYEEETLQNAGQ